MIVEGTRFGAIEYRDDQVLEFPNGLLADPAARKFLLVDEGTAEAVRWLVSVDRPGLDVALIDPSMVVRGYDVESIAGEETAVGVLLVWNSRLGMATADLRHPVVLHQPSRRGEQVTLDDATLPEAFPVLAPGTSERGV